VPEPEIRISLLAAAARLDDLTAIARFEAELVDRFGPIPAPTARLLEICRLRSLCRVTGMMRLSVGPRGVVIVPRTGRPARPVQRAVASSAGWRWDDGRVVLNGSEDPGPAPSSLD